MDEKLAFEMSKRGQERKTIKEIERVRRRIESYTYQIRDLEDTKKSLEFLLEEDEKRLAILIDIRISQINSREKLKLTSKQLEEAINKYK